MQMNIWIFLSAYLLILLLIMVLCYSAAISNWVNPNKCPKSFGDYGVEPGVTGVPLGSQYRFNVNGLLEATTKCDSDPLCTSFYYDNGLMIYLDVINNRYTAPNGGIYKRQINLNSS